MKYTAVILFLGLLTSEVAAVSCAGNRGVCQGGVCSDISGAGESEDPKCAALVNGGGAGNAANAGAATKKGKQNNAAGANIAGSDGIAGSVAASD